MPVSAVWSRFGAIRSAPVVAGGRGDNAHVFALDERRAVRHFRFNKAAPWTVPAASGPHGTDLGGELTSQPASYMRNDTVHVFGRGLDDAFWDNRSHDRGAHWTGWRRLGGKWRSAPSVAVAHPPGGGHRIVVVGTGDDANGWALTSTDDGENFAIGRFAAGAIPGEPTASTDVREHGVVVYARFPGGMKASDGGGWERAGDYRGSGVPVLASDPVALANGVLENVLGRDEHGRLWMYAYHLDTGHGGSGAAPASQIIGKPAAAVLQYGDFDPKVIVVARAPDNQLYSCRLDPGTGGEVVDFKPLLVSASSDPAVVGGHADHVILVFAREGDHLLYGRVPG